MAIEKRKAIKLTAIVLVVLTIFAAIFAAIYFGKQDAPVADKTLNVETEMGSITRKPTLCRKRWHLQQKV